MSTFSRYKPSSEKELHGIIEKEIDTLEEGLKILRYEFSTGKGIVDFLGVDSGGRLAIIEVKLNEDENILFQALRYYGDIDRYIINALYKGHNINPDQSLRVILIAEHFSEDIKRLSTLVKPDVELYEYTTLKSETGKIGIVYHSVTFPIVLEPISKPLSLEDHINYLTIDSLKTLFNKIREEIKSIGNNIEEYVTQSYVGYKYKGRQFAWIRSQRKGIELGAHIIDENKQLIEYDPKIISKEQDDYSEAIEKIKKSFHNLVGSIK